MKRSIVALVGAFLFSLMLPALPALASGITLVGLNSGTGNTMTLPSVPGRILSGDTIIAGVQGDCAQLSSASFNIVRAMKPNCGNVTSLFAYYRVSPGSEPASYAITANAGETTTAWDVRVYRGASPWPFSTLNPNEGGNGGGPNTTLYIPTGITTGLAAERFVGFFAWDCSIGTSSTFTPPAGMGNGDNVGCNGGGPSVVNFGIYGGDMTVASAGTAIARQTGTISAVTARAYTIGFTLVPAPSWSPQYINSTTGHNTVAIPSGTVSGNFMVLWCADYNRDPGDPNSATWTRVTAGGGGGGGQNLTFGMVWTRVATSSESTVTWSGVSGGGPPVNQSCVLATYSGISGVDAFATCYTGSTCQSSLTAPSVTIHNDIVVQMLTSGATNISISTGLGGEASASGGSMPDTIALVPAILRQNVAFTGSGGGAGNVAVSLCDYPFYGTQTNTPYTSQGTTTDLAVALALTPTSQPSPPPPATSGALLMMFP